MSKRALPHPGTESPHAQNERRRLNGTKKRLASATAVPPWRTKHAVPRQQRRRDPERRNDNREHARNGRDRDEAHSDSYTRPENDDAEDVIIEYATDDIGCASEQHEEDDGAGCSEHAAARCGARDNMGDIRDNGHGKPRGIERNRRPIEP